MCVIKCSKALFNGLSILALRRIRAGNLSCVCGDAIRNMAGHSKWANIKHTKAAKDAQKSTEFNKISRMIRVAIQEGGSTNPVTNLRLAQVVDQAKRVSMPVSSIQNILKTAQASKENSKAYALEIRGPGGCIIIVDILTDNLAKTKQALQTLLRKSNTAFATGGKGQFFDHKGIINVLATKDSTVESALEDAIEVGAEDVKKIEEENETLLQFVCHPDDFYEVKKKLEDLKYEVRHSSLEYLPHTTVELSDADLEIMGQLCDKLQDNPDVVKLYDNIA